MKIKFDEKGLIPVIVQDYLTGKILMQAFANQEAFDLMQKTKQTHFYSRSRKEIWHKGATSGNFQNIKQFLFDCDYDCLLVLVEQIGEGACHTGAFSCFENYQSYEFDSFAKLEITIEERMQKPQEKSYTNYLLNKGLDKICKKIGEETTETILELKNNNRKLIISEVADLLYHLILALKFVGISFIEIKQELLMRLEKDNNLKEQNIKGEI